MIEESPTSNVAILGHFNAGIDTQFEAELRELCNNLDLVVSDCDFYGRSSGMFTHVINAHGLTSWLDHVICSLDMQAKLQSVSIIYMLPSSDHVPLSAVFDFITTLILLTPLHVPVTKLILIGKKPLTKIY